MLSEAVDRDGGGPTNDDGREEGPLGFTGRGGGGPVQSICDVRCGFCIMPCGRDGELDGGWNSVLCDIPGGGRSVRSDPEGPAMVGRSITEELGGGYRGAAPLLLLELLKIPGVDRPFEPLIRIYVSHFFMNSLLGSSNELAKYS